MEFKFDLYRQNSICDTNKYFTGVGFRKIYTKITYLPETAGLKYLFSKNLIFWALGRKYQFSKGKLKIDQPCSSRPLYRCISSYDFLSSLGEVHYNFLFSHILNSTIYTNNKLKNSWRKIKAIVEGWDSRSPSFHKLFWRVIRSV